MCESATNNFGVLRFRSSGGSIITSTSYNYLWVNILIQMVLLMELCYKRNLLLVVFMVE